MWLMQNAHEEPRQRRRRLDRLHAPVRPRRALLYVGEDRQGGAGAPGGGNEQRRARRANCGSRVSSTRGCCPKPPRISQRISSGAETLMALGGGGVLIEVCGDEPGIDTPSALNVEPGEPLRRLTGGCQCGAVRYRIAAMPAGRESLPLPHVPEGERRPLHGVCAGRAAPISRSRSGALATFRSSDIAERGFCAACGTPLTYRKPWTSDRISVTIGSLDEPPRRRAHPPARRRRGRALALGRARHRQSPARRMAEPNCKSPTSAAASIPIIRLEQRGDVHGRSFHLRPRPHAARARQGRRLAAHRADAATGDGRAEGDQSSAIISKENEIDDVVMGCVDPVGEAGGDIPRMAALAAGLGQGVPGVQINRFCASGPRQRQFRRGAGDVGPARSDDRRRRRIDEPRRHRRQRRRLGRRSLLRDRQLFHAAGHIRRSHRHQIRLFARRRRRLRRAIAEARRRGLGGAALQTIDRPGQGHQRPHAARPRRAHAPFDRHAVAGEPETFVRR